VPLATPTHMYSLGTSYAAHYRKLTKLVKEFGGSAGSTQPRAVPLGVVQDGLSKVESFRACVPLIAAVCNPGMRPRHWATLAGLLGFEICQNEVCAVLSALLQNILHLRLSTNVLHMPALLPHHLVSIGGAGNYPAAAAGR
jgi:Dynein heavy chain, N-terminal region 2